MDLANLTRYLNRTHILSCRYDMPSAPADVCEPRSLSRLVSHRTREYVEGFVQVSSSETTNLFPRLGALLPLYERRSCQEDCPAFTRPSLLTAPPWNTLPLALLLLLALNLRSSLAKLRLPTEIEFHPKELTNR